MTDYVPTIRQLPGQRLAPETVLARSLDKREHIKAVAVIIQWQDDTYNVDWSQMKVSEFAAMAHILRMTVDEEFED